LFSAISAVKAFNRKVRKENPQRSQRTTEFSNNGFGYSDQGLRVSGFFALSGAAEKMKAHWKPGSRITKKETWQATSLRRRI
jgi:hypothetical protein